MIQQIIDENKQKDEDNKTESLTQMTIVEKDYYDVDGNFCSFPCMIAYYKANQKRNEYKNSQAMIKKMHQILYGKPLVWRCAPDIRLLKKFGGHLSIEEFRSEEGSCYVENIGMNRPKPKIISKLQPFVPIARLFNYHGTKY